MRELYQAKTQKAKGVYRLQQSAIAPVPSVHCLLDKTDAVNPAALKERLALGILANQRLFARPCPVRPRHGFVDSRVVKGEEEILQVLQETLAADPDGELMLMDVIKAQHSGIVTPSLLTVGAGNDGATAGKNTVNLPLIGIAEEIALLAKQSDVGEDEDPYLEVIRFSGSGYVVQLRAGPKMVGVNPDYIPAEMKVKRVIRAGGDLLEWETKVLGMVEGDVVYHPGGSLADHFFVHARSAKIPVLTTREPMVDEILTPLNEEPAVVPELVLRGAAAGFANKTLVAPNAATTNDGGGMQYGEQANLLLHILHHSAAMTGPHSWWLGYGAALAIRLGYLAGQGEARHFVGHQNKGRGYSYTQAADHPIETLVEEFPQLYAVFRYGEWSSFSFGGPKWAMCVKAAHSVLEELVKLAKEPTEAGVGALLRAINVMIHQEHNGGWWFNKFIDKRVMDWVPNKHLPSMINTLPAVYQAGQLMGMGKWEDWVERFKKLDVQLALPEAPAEAAYLPFTGSVFIRPTHSLFNSAGKGMVVDIVGARKGTVRKIMGTSITAAMKEGNLIIKGADGPLIEDEPLDLLPPKEKK